MLMTKYSQVPRLQGGEVGEGGEGVGREGREEREGGRRFIITMTLLHCTIKICITLFSG